MSLISTNSDVAICDFNLNFQGQNFQLLLTRKRLELALKCIRMTFTDVDILNRMAQLLMLHSMTPCLCFQCNFVIIPLITELIHRARSAECAVPLKWCRAF